MPLNLIGQEVDGFIFIHNQRIHAKIGSEYVPITLAHTNEDKRLGLCFEVNLFDAVGSQILLHCMVTMTNINRNQQHNI